MSSPHLKGLSEPLQSLGGNPNGLVFALVGEDDATGAQTLGELQSWKDVRVVVFGPKSHARREYDSNPGLGVVDSGIRGRHVCS
jgi:hypothetical protein